MSKITAIHWKEFEKFLLFVGCVLERQKGDHRIYSREGLKRPVVIPKDKNLPVFVIRNNLKILNISHNEYLEILKKL